MENHLKSLLLTIALGMLFAAAAFQGARASDARPLTDNQIPPALDNRAREANSHGSSSDVLMDHGMSDADLAISRQIRRSVAYRDALSTSASNVTIATRDGVVTLTGSVKSADERASISVISAASTGVKRVDNQLEIEGHR